MNGLTFNSSTSLSSSKNAASEDCWLGEPEIRLQGASAKINLATLLAKN